MPPPPALPARTARQYSLPDAFFKTAIRNAIHDSLFSPVSLGEKHDVRLKPAFNTACWAYLPPHQIFIGTDLFEKDMVKPGLTQVQQEKYIANHYHHELGHGLFTERDMKRIQRGLKAIECAFSLFNLFEDAWMEERYRKAAEYQFEWLTLESLQFTPRPESLLFALIQAEGDVAVVEKALQDWAPPPKPVSAGAVAVIVTPEQDPEEIRTVLQGQFQRVFEYYLRILGVAETMHQMPILQDWLTEFGRPPEAPPGGPSGGGMADLELSAKLMTDAKALAEFEANVEEVTAGKSDDTSLSPSVKGKAKPIVDDALVGQKGTVLHSTATPVDVDRATGLANRFKRFFAEKSRVVATRTPQRRVSARHFALDRAPYRKVEIEGRGAKKVFFEIDCSGSMGGFHIMEGKLIIAALSILARQGHISGHVALSAVISEPAWELYKLPLEQATIDRIQGYAGAEGLEYTMRDNLALLREADFVFVYTDAQICDKPIDKEFFHRYGVYTWGLYAGDRGNFIDEMLTYFDKAILRDNAEALVDAMLIQQK